MQVAPQVAYARSVRPKCGPQHVSPPLFVFIGTHVFPLPPHIFEAQAALAPVEVLVLDN